MSDAVSVLTYVLGALLCPWEGWIAASDEYPGSAEFSLPFASSVAILGDIEKIHIFLSQALFSLQSTYSIRKTTGITTQGTMILTRWFPLFSLLPVFACENEVDEREEEAAAEDVGDCKLGVDNVGN